MIDGNESYNDITITLDTLNIIIAKEQKHLNTLVNHYIR